MSYCYPSAALHYVWQLRNPSHHLHLFSQWPSPTSCFHVEQWLAAHNEQDSPLLEKVSGSGCLFKLRGLTGSLLSLFWWVLMWRRALLHGGNPQSSVRGTVRVDVPRLKPWWLSYKDANAIRKGSFTKSIPVAPDEENFYGGITRRGHTICTREWILLPPCLIIYSLLTYSLICSSHFFMLSSPCSIKSLV